MSPEQILARVQAPVLAAAMRDAAWHNMLELYFERVRKALWTNKRK